MSVIRYTAISHIESDFGPDEERRPQKRLTTLVTSRFLRWLTVLGVLSFGTIAALFRIQQEALLSRAESSLWWLVPSKNTWAQARHYALEGTAALGDILPNPPPSAWYTQLIFDSLLFVPALPTTEHNTRLKGTAAFRHVSLRDGKLVLHVPSLRVHSVAFNDDAYINDAGSSAAAFSYDGELTGRWPGEEHFYVGVRQWLNSTQWPVPSMTRLYSQATTETPRSFPSSLASTSSSRSPSYRESISATSHQCHPTQHDYP